MAGIPRLLVTNRIQAAATVLAESGSDAGSPVSRLKDQLRSKTWRQSGWKITTLNRGIDFNRGGVKLAIVATGTYATGAALATAIVAALEAEDATPVWACSYDSGTKKFTISSDLAFTLLFGTGANLAASIHVDLGYATSDTSSATSHTAGSVAYQSRHALTADAGSSLGDTAAIAINHNAGTGGTFTFQAHSADLGSLGYLAATDFAQNLAGNADIRVAYFSEQTKRYRRLLINDVQNPLGYSEVGIWYAGPYTQPTISYAIGIEKAWEELSEVTVAIPGAHFVDERARRPTWGLQWSEAPEADRAALAAAFALVPKGRNFFFCFDGTTPTTTEYVFIPEGVSERLTSGLYFDIPVALAGALG